MNCKFTMKEVIDTLMGKRVRETTPYVYAVIDSITHKWYIGCRMAKGCHPSELGVSYFTSSKVLRPKFKTNPERFIKKVLYIGIDALDREIELLHIMSAKESESSYNMHNGNGGFDAKKAAETTVLLRVGVHSRTKEQMSKDANLMVSIHKKAGTGIFAPGAAQKGRDTQKILGVAAFSRENRSKGGITSGNQAKANKTGIHAFTKEQLSEAAKKAHLTRFKCAECEMEGSGNSIALHQKAKKHQGRIKLEK